MTIGGEGGSAKVTKSDRGSWGVKIAFLIVTSLMNGP